MKGDEGGREGKTRRYVLQTSCAVSFIYLYREFVFHYVFVSLQEV